MLHHSLHRAHADTETVGAATARSGAKFGLIAPFLTELSFEAAKFFRRENSPVEKPIFRPAKIMCPQSRLWMNPAVVF